VSFLVHERSQYEPPACPGCLRRQEFDWINCTLNTDPEPRYLPGQTYCRTSGCVYNDLEQAR
jgi:hypothetical protein